MSMNLNLPGNLSRAAPGQPFEAQEYVFDHVPSLRELLPQYRGLPGFEYMQCCVQHLRRAQDEGWVEVQNTVVYSIEGPNGRVDMKLLARGQRIPGQPHDSGVRLCLCDKTVEKATGLWINPNRHESENSEAEKGDTQKSDTSNPTFVGGQPSAAKSK